MKLEETNIRRDSELILILPPQLRMPFKKSIRIGEGSRGVVSKELVAAKHFHKGEFWNPEVHCIKILVNGTKG